MIPAFLLLLGLSSPAYAATEAGPLLVLAEKIRADEAAVPGAKPSCEARVILASPTKPVRTPLTFLYLHGFSASPREISPFTEDLAKAWGANAYLPRYRGHCIQGPDGMKGVRLEDWETETRDALAVAKQLGERVVVVSMSTGSTLAVPALIEDSSQVAAFVMLSPNFRIHRRETELLRLPFADGIARLVMGKYREWKALNADHEYFWTTKYPSETVVQVVRATVRARNAPLEKLQMPVFVAYSPVDTVVDVPSLKQAFDRIGSKQKHLLEVQGAENDHIIAGSILAPKSSAVISARLNDFLRALLPKK